VLEIFLVLLEHFVLSLGEEVKNLHEALELFGVSSALREKLLIEIVLIIELSYLGFWVKESAGIIIPVGACKFSEKIKLVLSATRLGELLALCQEEG